MSDVRFTPEQQQAIDTTDRSVLVSAAAGSGKTAVLIERIIRIILDGKANVDEMLVVTFTNAAASEMRIKLAKAMRRHMKEHPESRPMLKEQLSRLYRAYISTFSSFAMRIVREFFYEIDADPGFTVCDEIRGALLQNEAIDELFDLCFENDEYVEGCSFREFLRLYSSDRNENAIKQELISTYHKLRSMPDYFEWAYANAELLNMNRQEFFSSEAGLGILAGLGEAVAEAYAIAGYNRSLFEEAGLTAMYQKSTASAQSLEAEESELAQLHSLISSGADADEVLEALTQVHFDNMPRAAAADKAAYEGIKEEVKAGRDHYKKQLNDWIEAYLLPDIDTRIREMNESYRYTVYYLRLLEKFEELYTDRKRAQKLMDFGDMEHTASRILKKPETAAILRKRFRFIFIDEYQDTNNIQEHLINALARPDNIFKVGDVKQSIYKFRQAEPAIFERVRADYADPDNQDATALDLNMNFRTNSRTIDYINCVFGDIMEGYDEAAALKPGLDFSDYDQYNFTPEFHLLVDEGADSADEEEPQEELDEVDNELRTLSKEEAEAKHVASIVRSIIGTTFYDSKAGEIREATPRDITILLRAVKVRGETYAHALKDVQIDAHIEEEADYFDAIEIRTAYSLLQAIDNMKKDIPLIATLRSEIFGFTTGELATIRADYKAYQRTDSELSGRRHYYQAAEWYEVEGENAELRNKLHSALEKLREYRRLSSVLPLDQFIWRLLLETDYYLYAGAIRGGDRRQANLRALVDRASAFARDNIATLSDFLSYLEVLQTRKIKTGQSKISSKDDDVVQITTIHKSKGLEYPFVIVAGLGNGFKFDSRSKGCLFDSSLGLGLSYVSPDLRFWRSTLLQRAINEHSRSEALREEERVLYVAMTRARNKLYMVGVSKTDMRKVSPYVARTSYLSMMQSVIRTPYNRQLIAPLVREDRLSSFSRIEAVLSTRRELAQSDIGKQYTFAADRLSYEYPDKEVLTRRSKISVSTLRREELEAEEQAAARAAESADEEVYNLWKAIEYRKTKASRADIGTAYHRIMEQLDFSKAIDSAGKVDKAYIDSTASALVEAGAIAADIWSSIRLEHIYAFFESSLGRRAAAASIIGNLMKEKPFTLRIEHEGHPALVQGVIDCCFVENGSYVLIDYKSSYISYKADIEKELERIRHEYSPQTRIYRQAIEEGSGLEVKEVYLHLFSIDRAIAMPQ